MNYYAQQLERLKLLNIHACVNSYRQINHYHYYYYYYYHYWL
jgi:hypothetical protein